MKNNQKRIKGGISLKTNKSGYKKIEKHEKLLTTQPTLISKNQNTLMTAWVQKRYRNKRKEFPAKYLPKTA